MKRFAAALALLFFSLPAVAQINGGGGGGGGSVPTCPTSPQQFVISGSACAVPAGGGNVNTSGVITSGAIPIWNGATTVTGTFTPSNNELVYATGGAFANLATANSSVLVTDGTGVPSLSTTLPSGLTIPGYNASISWPTSGSIMRSNGGNAPTAYAGTTCTNQAVTALSAAGAATCNSITSAYLSGSITAAQMLGLASGDVYQGNGSNVPAAVTLSAAIDAAIGSTQGDMLYRGASAWSILAPGTAGNLLQTGGAGANPSWTAAPATTITLDGPGLSDCSGPYNPGTQTITNGSNLCPQLYYRGVGTSTVLAATDGGYLTSVTAGSLTITAPNPGTVGTSTFTTGWDGTHPYTLTTAGGTASIYGCGPSGTSVTLYLAAELVTDGTNYECLPSGDAALEAPQTFTAANTFSGGLVSSGTTKITSTSWPTFASGTLAFCGRCSAPSFGTTAEGGSWASDGNGYQFGGDGSTFDFVGYTNVGGTETSVIEAVHGASYVTASNNMTIGATTQISANDKLSVSTGVSAKGISFQDTSAAGYGYIKQLNDTNAVAWTLNGTTDTTDNCAAANCYQLALGSSGFYITGLGADTGKTDATVCRVTTGGQILTGTGTGGVCLGTSSMRFKQAITDEIGGLRSAAAMTDDFMRLRPVDFRYRAGVGYDPKKPYSGFLAEDVVNVWPTLVGKDDQGRPNTVDMFGMVPRIIAQVQIQQWEILGLVVWNFALTIGLIFACRRKH